VLSNKVEFNFHAAIGPSALIEPEYDSGCRRKHVNYVFKPTLPLKSQKIMPGRQGE
jgi:hypothetical protein